MRGRSQPPRAHIVGHDRLRVISNGLAQTMLGRLRDRRTGVHEFGVVARELAHLLVWEACRDVPLGSARVPGFSSAVIDVATLDERVAGVVILRAGMLFAHAFRSLLPEAPLHQIGVKRDEVMLSAVVYADNLPVTPGWADRVLLFDPMLATGGSASVAVERIRRAHTGSIEVLSLLAAPLGVERVLNIDAACRVFTIALDERLDDGGYILPGLGDAGDRLFGTFTV